MSKFGNDPEFTLAKGDHEGQKQFKYGGCNVTNKIISSILIVKGKKLCRRIF